MQQSGIPTKIPTIWGVAASSPYINPIPIPSQIGIQNGKASFTDGFPPNCFIQQAAGGAGPFGEDFNGILQLMSQWLQWYQAGAPVQYDASFQSAVGGYPANAVVQSARTPGLLWLSTVDNNLSNPDIGGAGWLPLGQPYTLDTGTVNNYSATNLAISQRLPGLAIRLLLANTNTGNSVFNAGYGALQVLTPAGFQTPPGFLPAGAIVTLIDIGGSWFCAAGGGRFAGGTDSWLEISPQGMIRQGGVVDDSVHTSGLVTFSSQPNGMVFPESILSWHVENLSSSVIDAQKFMSAGNNAGGGTDTNHLQWYCTTSNGATPSPPNIFRWEAMGL